MGEVSNLRNSIPEGIAALGSGDAGRMQRAADGIQSAYNADLRAAGGDRAAQQRIMSTDVFKIADRLHTELETGVAARAASTLSTTTAPAPGGRAKPPGSR